MVIGLLTVELYLPSVHSLKHKRQILKSLIARVRNKYNVSVSEIEHNDLWQRASLGCCIVTNDSRYASQVLDKVMGEMGRNLEGEILNYEARLL